MLSKLLELNVPKYTFKPLTIVFESEDKDSIVDAEVKQGRMHKILNVPADKKIQDVYDSGESLANALTKKVGHSDAMKMLNYAANIRTSHDIFDAARNYLKESEEIENDMPTIKSGGSINEQNKSKYAEYKAFHIEDGGKYPDAYAVTELIRQSILNKDYKIYYGGGYEAKTESEIKQFDVVVTFNYGGDPLFQMCVDNSDGDACKLINSNEDCTFVVKYL